jgi:hypothetical protein
VQPDDLEVPTKGDASRSAVTSMPPRRRRWVLWALPVLLAVPVVVLGASGLWIGACRGRARDVPPAGPTSSTAEICADAAARPDDACMAPTLIPAELESAAFEVLDAHVTAHGHSLPQRLRIRVPRHDQSAVVYHVKWKHAPPSGDESNNSPRRELAAFALQELLFDPDHYVVPPTAMRCLPLDDPRVRVHGATAFAGTRCALGMLAFWVPNVRELTEAEIVAAGQDRRLGAAVGDLNVFTYVAEHRDGIGQNFLFGQQGARPRAFAVDNGMSFGAWRYHPMRLLSSGWCDLKVRTLRADLVRRLRELRRDQLDRLAVVAQLALDERGILQNTERAPVFAGQQDLGVRRSQGALQLGLTTTEIDDVHARLRELVERAASGDVVAMD